MREPDFRSLKARLLRHGIAFRHVDRVADELRDHFEDLVEEGMIGGASIVDARTVAAEKLGDMDTFIRQMRSRRELRSWAFRFPLAAIVLYPLGCLMALPALPIVAGMSRAGNLARWGTSILLAGFFTASMLLVLQLSIALG